MPYNFTGILGGTTLLHEISATTKFGEFEKFAEISCRQNYK